MLNHSLAREHSRAAPKEKRKGPEIKRDPETRAARARAKWKSLFSAFLGGPAWASRTKEK